MDLHQDFHIRAILVDVIPDLVDDDADRRLRNPGDCFRQDHVNPVEDVPAVAEFILHEAVLLYLLFCALVPFLNARVRAEPDLLRPIYLRNGSPQVAGDGSGTADVVSRMAEDLSELPLQLHRAAMILVARVGFHQFFKGRRLLSVDNVGV